MSYQIDDQFRIELYPTQGQVSYSKFENGQFGESLRLFGATFWHSHLPYIYGIVQIGDNENVDPDVLQRIEETIVKELVSDKGKLPEGWEIKGGMFTLAFDRVDKAFL